MLNPQRKCNFQFWELALDIYFRAAFYMIKA